MQIQNLLLGASLSALLAATSTATAAENTAKKEGNAMEAQGNVQDKRAVREKEAAEKSAAAGETKDDRLQESAKTQKAHAKRTQKELEANPRVNNQTKNADNTKLNTRDRKDTLTPMDQSNREAQIAITASIRKGIMSDKTVSFNGKNIKIITLGTRVTLRGPVKSTQERTSIEGIAKRTAGVTEVDNQLEVTN